MGRFLRRLHETRGLRRQVHRGRRRQRPQPCHIRGGQRQPVIGRAGKPGPRHLGQTDISQGHRRGAGRRDVVELERQPHDRRRAQRGDRHRINPGEIQHIGLEAGGGIQLGIRPAQHLFDHGRRAAAAIVLQGRGDLLQHPSRHRRLHLEGQAQGLAQPFHRKGQVLIPALPGARRADGDPCVILPDRAIGVLHPVRRDRPRAAAQRPFVGHLRSTSGHRRRGCQPFVIGAVLDIAFIRHQIAAPVGKTLDLNDAAIADVRKLQIGFVGRLRGKDAPQVIINLDQPVLIGERGGALEHVEARAIAHPGPPDRIAGVKRVAGRGQALEVQLADLQTRRRAGRGQRPGNRRRLIGGARQPDHRRVVGAHPCVHHVQRLDGHRGAVQPEIAEIGDRAVDALDMQRVDDQPLQSLQPHRIAAIGAMFDVQLANKTARTLPGDAKAAFGCIGRTTVDIQVQPHRPGARGAANVHAAIAVAADLQRAIGDTEFAAAIVADRGADLVKDNLVDD